MEQKTCPFARALPVSEFTRQDDYTCNADCKWHSVVNDECNFLMIFDSIAVELELVHDALANISIPQSNKETKE